MLTKAANKLGLDQVEIRKINAPVGKAKFGPGTGPRQTQAYVTSAFVKEALDKGAELFNWEEKKARSGKRVGNKVRGSGVAISAFSGGLDRLRWTASSSSRTVAYSSRRASATSARTRSSTCIASRPT